MEWFKLNCIPQVKITLLLAGLCLVDACQKDFIDITPNGLLDDAVLAVYEGISRCNVTISAARAAFETGSITVEELESFISQARALRGFYRRDSASQ